MRIGELLGQQGLVREADLDAALRTQQQYGGRVASILVELGYLDGDAATRALAKQKQAPAALQKHFDAVDRKALSKLTPKVAERLGAIPLGFTGESTLLVAMVDPTDLSAAEEVRFAVGMKIIAGIALDTRVRRALHALYGIPRKSSERAFVAVTGRPEQEIAQVPTRYVVEPSQPPRTPPPPGFQTLRGAPDLTLDPPPPSSQPRSALPPMSLPPIVPRISDSAPRMSSDSPRISDSAPRMSSEAPRSRSYVPPLAREEPGAAAAPRSDVVRAPTRPSRAPAALSREETLHAIANAPTLETRAELLLRYLRSAFDAAVIFAVRNDVAFAWKAFSPTVAGPDAPRIAVPLTQPSLLTLPYEARSVFCGGVPDDGESPHDRIWQALGTARPRAALALPIVVDGAVASLVYAQRAAEAIASSTIVDVNTLAAAVARR